MFPNVVHHIAGLSRYPAGVRDEIESVVNITRDGLTAYALARVEAERAGIDPGRTPYLAAIIAQVEATGTPCVDEPDAAEASPIPTLAAIAFQLAGASDKEEAIGEWLNTAAEPETRTARHANEAVAVAFALPDDPRRDRVRLLHATLLLMDMVRAVRTPGADIADAMVRVGEMIDEKFPDDEAEHPRIAWLAALLGMAAMHGAGAVQLIPNMGAPLDVIATQDPGSN